MGNRRDYLIDNIVSVCKKLDAKGFGANHDGNVSVKFDGGLLATPTSISKGEMVPELVLTLDIDGKKIDGIGKPFSEIDLHIAAYRVLDNVSAVVHAHPPFATTMGLAGKPLRPRIPEAIVSIGDLVPVVHYAFPGSDESRRLTSEALASSGVVMIQGNGVLSTGADIEQAYLRLELVEHLAKIEYYSAGFGASFEIPESDADKLMEKHCSIFGKKQTMTGPKDNSQDNSLKDLISEEIRKILTECERQSS